MVLKKPVVTNNPEETKKKAKIETKKKTKPRKRALRRGPVLIKTGEISKINKKLDKLEKKMEVIRKEQKETEDNIEESVDSTHDVVKKEVSKVSKEVNKVEGEVDNVEKNIGKIGQDIDIVEKNINKLGKDVEKIEENLLTIGRFTVGREHFMEMARGAAGAFLGVGIGLSTGWVPGTVAGLQWVHIIAILAFVLGIGSILIFKYEKEWVDKHGNVFVIKRITYLFIISLGIQFIALILFNLLPGDVDTIVRVLIAGSYPAMAGAITFTIA